MCEVEAHVYMPLLEALDYAPTPRYAYADELLALEEWRDDGAFAGFRTTETSGAITS
jgi:hypothetical protein